MKNLGATLRNAAFALTATATGLGLGYGAGQSVDWIANDRFERMEALSQEPGVIFYKNYKNAESAKNALETMAQAPFQRGGTEGTQATADTIGKAQDAVDTTLDTVSQKYDDVKGKVDKGVKLYRFGRGLLGDDLGDGKVANAAESALETLDSGVSKFNLAVNFADFYVKTQQKHIDEYASLSAQHSRDKWIGRGLGFLGGILLVSYGAARMRRKESDDVAN